MKTHWLPKPKLTIYLIAIAVPLTSQLNSAAAGRPAVENILADWRERQSKTVSVIYKLAGTAITPKGVFTGDPVFPAGTIVPAEDHKSALKLNVIMDFDHTWFMKEKWFDNFHADVRQFFPWYWGTVYDGSVLRDFEPRDKITSTAFTPSKAHIDLHMATPKLSSITLVFGDVDLPIFVSHGFVPVSRGKALLPKRSIYPLKEADFHFWGHGRIGESACTILRSTLQDTPQYEYWVDESRQSSILRIKTFVTIHNQIDIKYQHIAWGWVPKAWAVTEYAGEEPVVLSYRSVAVKSVQVNPRLAKEQFQGMLKPGMIVKNHDDRKHYQVQEDLTLAEIDRAQLLYGKQYSRPIIIGTILLVGIIASVGWLVYRHFTRRSADAD